MVDIEIYNSDFSLRFFNTFDDRARSFEEEVKNQHSHGYQVIDKEGTVRHLTWPNLSYWQSYRHLDHSHRPFFVLQATDRVTEVLHQIAITVEVSRVSLFQNGIVQKWIPVGLIHHPERHRLLLNWLIHFCRRHTQVMNLRLQPYLPGEEHLRVAKDILNSLRFTSISPTSYTQTRFVDLRPEVSDILALFNANGRVKLRIKDKYAEEASVKDISDETTTPFLQKALNESFLRSAKKECHYNFQPLFKSAAQFTQDVSIIGFYLKESPLEPKAFITGVRHHHMVEFSVGGSRSDERLRKFPFNHILIWQLILRSKKQGGQFFDMGGISSGAAGDALQGISAFKRLFPGFELTVGSEMHLPLRLPRSFTYSVMQKISRVLQ
ncbi:MAG: hypothetical protein ACKOX6_07765 [Bdellovibrio sp.]